MTERTKPLYPALEAGLRDNVGVDAPARINAFCNSLSVVAGNDNDITLGVDAGNNADVATAFAPHHGDGANPRAGDARTIRRERARHIGTAARMACTFQNVIHERGAPQARLAGRVAADIAAGF